MKARRQKKSQPRKVVLAMEEVPTAPSSFFLSKHPSAHNKPLSNTSLHQNAKMSGGVQMGRKGKKSGNPTGREGLPTSKSSKKIRVPAITLHRSKQNEKVPEESYREYCLVDHNFFGLSLESEEALSTHFLAKATASTCDFSSFKPTKPSCHAEQRLRKKSISQRSMESSTQ